ncbi:MAG TPA: F0F1 ATP synthase subunit A [Clostridia bacterium]|jgi:F-type H+-transporting ATPase subunit a|nr:F0F1 ATP synthase subunit A [Clostridia bacterium]
MTHYLLAAESGSSLGEIMKKAVLPDDVNFLGVPVNPSFFSALIVTGVILFFCLILRIFFIPRMKKIPGRGQVVLEKAVTFFSGLANSHSPGSNRFLGAYVFSAAVFVFFGTMIELIGLRPILVDINACIAIALCSFGTIIAGGVKTNGPKGALHALKDFSLPLSMSFRLFGSMLSGLIMTALVYEFIALSFVVPVFVGVIFTVFHAVIQTYVLTLLTSMFYGGAAEPIPKKTKTKKIKKRKNKKQNLENIDDQKEGVTSSI